MSRPSAETIAAVDEAVRELDATIAPDASTRSWALMLEDWNYLRALMFALDMAIGEPFAERSAETLIELGGALDDRTAKRLAFELTHAGEAIQRRRHRQQESK